MKIFEIKPEFVVLIPEVLEEGKLYISGEYSVAIHLCACGCGIKTVTPLGWGGWTLYHVNGITLMPSIGNFRGESPHHAHYYITNNKIIWL